MQQFANLWNGLSPQRRLLAAGTTAAVFAAVLVLARMATAPDMALLYGGLDGPAAGEVIAALEQRGIRHEARGDSVYVDRAERDRTRMSLAAQGLPASGVQGYELLDGLTGFGTTAQMFDAAQARAREGELARTIAASPHIRAARVHIAQPARQAFRHHASVTASVTLTPVAEGLPPGQARAIRFLVAGAVPGLPPDQVTIIDADSGRLLDDASNATLPGQGGTHAAELRRAVERLLEAHVGPGRAVVEVSVETVTERESIRERRLDPDGRVAVSIDSEERRSAASGGAAAAVTVASNLPETDTSAGAGQSQTSEQRSRQNYEVSELTREVQREPGAVRRITVAALVDGIVAPGPDGAPAWQPRGENELAALTELIASAVGHDAARGDSIVIRSLPFEELPSPGVEDPGTQGIFWQRLDPNALLVAGLLALVALALIVFVLRPLIRRDGASSEPMLPVSSGAPALPGNGEAAAAGAGLLAGIPEFGVASPDEYAAVMGGSELRDPEDPVLRLKRLIQEREDEAVEVLRSWMEDEEEEQA